MDESLKMEKFQNFILMDNFRGFSNTVIPLEKTNFFVGENSSGKSSVLALIQIISSYDFWFNFEFKTDAINLGHFSDIVSVDASNKSYFRVGYLKDLNTNKVDEEHLFSNGFFATFTEKNGAPNLKHLSILFENSILHIKVNAKTIGYKIEDRDLTTINTIAEAQRILNSLISTHETGKGYTNFKSQYGKSNHIFILFHELSIAVRKEKIPIDDLVGALHPNFRPIWLAPIRSKPKRTYDDPTSEFSSEGDHTPYLLRSILTNKKRLDIKNLLEKIGKNTGLFKEVTLKKYGRNKNSPFELDVVLDKSPLSILNVGYGVSQSMPIIAEIISRPNNSWFIIQQPEVHLHPKAQAAIGDVIFDSAVSWHNTSLIETHSDYMIDRFRLRIVQTNNKSNELPSSQILFFSRKNGGNFVYPIKINKEGELSDNQPNEYRDFFINEQMQILGL